MEFDFKSALTVASLQNDLVDSISPHVSGWTKVWQSCSDGLGRNKIGRASKNSGPIVSRLWTKVHEILGQCIGDPLYFSASLPDCLCHVLFRRYSPLSVKVVEKPNKCKSFLAHNFSWGRGGRPKLFYGRLFARFTVRRVTKFGWVPFAGVRLWTWQWRRKQNLHRVGKKRRPSLKPFVDQSSWHLRRCRRPLVVVNTLTYCLYHVWFRRYRPLKLPLSC